MNPELEYGKIYQKWNPADQSESERQKGTFPLKPFSSNQGRLEQQQTCPAQAESKNTLCIQPSLYLSKFTKQKQRCHHHYLYPTTQEAQPSAQTPQSLQAAQKSSHPWMFNGSRHKTKEVQNKSTQSHWMSMPIFTLRTSFKLCLRNLASDRNAHLLRAD